jgi:hypothetical protein
VAVVHGLLAGTLLLACVCAGGQQPEARRDQGQAGSIELTNSHPEASFVVSPEVVASSPAVLELRFTRVVNPARTEFQIFVYLSYRPGDEADAAPIRILLGNGNLYPADRPGAFRLRASTAFGKLKAAKASGVRLVLEMKRMHRAEPWSQVEVTVTRPQWRGENE